MTRTECEAKIKELFSQIVDIYREYRPEGKYLTLDLTKGVRCNVNNACYPNGDDYDSPIDTQWTYEKEKPAEAGDS